MINCIYVYKFIIKIHIFNIYNYNIFRNDINAIEYEVIIRTN